MSWWVATTLNEENGRVILVSWLVWVIVSIVLHELAHGWAAIRVGDRTPIETGHMTPNPIVHMGPFSLIALILLGITWGAMPVDPTRMRGRYAEALVALAGPAMNGLLAVACIILGAFWVAIAGGYWFDATNLSDQPIYANFRLFFVYGAIINVMLGLFNLIPIYPLDGGRILGCINRGYARFCQTQGGVFLSICVFILVFMFGFVVLMAIGMFVGYLGTELLAMLLTAGESANETFTL